MGQMTPTDARVIAVRGAVLDVTFDGPTLPPIEDALLVTPDKGTPIIAEVLSFWPRFRNRGNNPTS